jgi:N-glycosylase/DNA lyase
MGDQTRRASRGGKSGGTETAKRRDHLAARLTDVPYVGEFNLETTLNSGQVFHWRRRGAGWDGMIGDAPCYVVQEDTALRVHGVEAATARQYFGLDHPLADIVASFPRDTAMEAAVGACRGLRVIRQPLWECVATFITSAQKAVPHIAQISHTLRSRYGRRVEWEGGAAFTYPTPEALAVLSEEELRSCALGYRAKNLLKTAQMVANGEVDLQAVARLDDGEAHAALCRLAGVGPKVANCALLFAFERLSAFPIDVWIERVLRTLYFARKRRVTTKRMQEFSANYFGPYGGYAQQYLFHHARMQKKAGGLSGA